METYQLIIIGAGGFATQVIETFKANKISISGIVDDHRKEQLMGYPILGTIEDLKTNQIVANSLFCAIGDRKIRENIYKMFLLGWNVNCIHPTAHIGMDVNMGFGNYIGPNTVVMPRAKIGDNNIIDPLSVISHDVVIGNHNHFAAQSCLLGNVKINNGNLLGAQCTVLPKLSIENYNIIGAGAVCTKSLTNKIKVRGVPARKVDPEEKE
jgi:sugar O-acyltransferase (sialic acid O-acetyltransferase NeuD family)